MAFPANSVLFLLVKILAYGLYRTNHFARLQKILSSATTKRGSYEKRPSLTIALLQ